MLLAIAFSYVLVHGSNQIVSGSSMTLTAALAKREAYGSNFLWFKKDGHRYLIRDAATLDRIDHLFDRVRVWDPDADRLRDKIRPLEERESKLDHEIDALTDRDDDDAQLPAAEENHLRDLEREMNGVEQELRKLERQQDELDRKRDALEAEAETDMVPILDEAIRNGVATEIR